MTFCTKRNEWMWTGIEDEETEVFNIETGLWNIMPSWKKEKPEEKRDFGRRYPNGKRAETKDKKETRREKKFRKKDRYEGRGKRLRAKARQEGKEVENGRVACRTEPIRFTVTVI